MKKDIRKKEYMIQEVVAYYVLGYETYSKTNKENQFLPILKNILEIAKENLDTTEVKGISNELLNKIHFSWKLSADDFVAYATCIFYVLTNRESKITREKIVKEFLTEIHSHHPRRTLKEANFILENLFPELKEDNNGDEVK